MGAYETYDKDAYDTKWAAAKGFATEITKHFEGKITFQKVGEEGAIICMDKKELNVEMLKLSANLQYKKIHVSPNLQTFEQLRKRNKDLTESAEEHEALQKAAQERTDSAIRRLTLNLRT